MNPSKDKNQQPTLDQETTNQTNTNQGQASKEDQELHEKMNRFKEQADAKLRGTPTKK